MSKCPNVVYKTNPSQEKSDWDLLVDKVGINQAYMNYMLNNDEIPSLEAIQTIEKMDSDLALDEARTIYFDRSIIKDTFDRQTISPEEIAWFQEKFPNIPIEKVQGLIEDKALGRFISNGKVLLSSEATENTLRHEAFHAHQCWDCHRARQHQKESG